MTFRTNDDGVSAFARTDRGSGSLNDYRFDLIPRSRKIVIRVAGSDPYQDELQSILHDTGADAEMAGGRRTAEEERTDAPMEVRLFTGRRVSGLVGIVPRGLEPAIDAGLTRLENLNKMPRIPALIVKTRHGFRVDLLIGQTRDS